MLSKSHKNQAMPVRLVVLSAVLLACVPLISSACSTYYVATNGNDNNPGTLTNPWKSIAKSGYKIKACDTLYVRGGVYNEYGVYLLQNSTMANPTRVLAYNNESPILDGTGTTAGLYDVSA